MEVSAAINHELQLLFLNLLEAFVVLPFIKITMDYISSSTGRVLRKTFHWV